MREEPNVIANDNVPGGSALDAYASTGAEAMADHAALHAATQPGSQRGAGHVGMDQNSVVS
jgi:hypothetical protein